MLENRDFLLFAYLMEVIHVKLADKRRELTVLKEFGQYLVFEDLLVLNDEAVAPVSPLDDMCVSHVLSNSPITSRILYVFMIKFEMSDFL